MIDWGATGALVTSGASTLLAFGPETWPIDLAGAKDLREIGLKDQALSASGTGILGSHIVHPYGGEDEIVYPARRMWVLAATAAQADAWSTACMLMSPEDLTTACAESGVVDGLFADRGDRVEELGVGLTRGEDLIPPAGTTCANALSGRRRRCRGGEGR